MKKYLHITFKVLFSLILLVPILGVFGVLPSPTRELYNTDIAFAFIEMLSETKYINYTMVVVQIATLGALWTRRESLAALLILPITVNIIGFHAFIDGGLFTAGAILGNLLLILNLYFLWENQAQYKDLWRGKTGT